MTTDFYNLWNVLQFIQTEMGSKIDHRIVDRVGGFLPMEMVIAGMFNFLFIIHSIGKVHYIWQLKRLVGQLRERES